ncbi:hypothetical protein HGG76_06080 [Ochrobactrum tritici]|uniref:Uncharacterized protein n=1 Tax=Brucella tritici TaxID=94626 RepID=A0A7X6FRQ5_9HYPH|nr:hypothetical protein [Brucella tritici]
MPDDAVTTLILGSLVLDGFGRLHFNDGHTEAPCDFGHIRSGGSVWYKYGTEIGPMALTAWR